MRPLSLVKKHLVFTHKDTLIGRRLWFAFPSVSSRGTINYMQCKTSTRPLPSAEKHSTFAPKDTPTTLCF